MGKKIAVIFLTLVLILLTGCQQGNHLAQSKPAVSTPEGTEVCLKILTEDFQELYDFRMGKILEIIMERYTDEHPNVTFEIEYLPHEKNEAELREMRIEQLRYEILAGKGPDVLLLYTPVYSNYSLNYDTWSEPVFTDVNVAMRNGVFHEISAYYNADDELIKEELKQEIMDAGTFGEARYVLPLAYEMPVIHVSGELAQKYGMTEDELTAGAGSIQVAVLRAMQESKEGSLDSCLGYDPLLDFYPFGQVLDYDNGTVRVSAQELEERLRQTQEIDRLGRTLDSAAKFPIQCTRMEFYLEKFVDPEAYTWNTSGNPFYVETSQHAFEYSVIRHLDGGQYTSHPVRANDGTVTAKVTAWGAVGAGCDYADIAYDFLREFLTREVQWDLERNAVLSEDELPFCWDGIPVRTEGLVEPMLDRYKMYYKKLDYLTPQDNPEAFLAKLDELLAVEMTDEDFPILDVKIDQVLFESSYEQEYRILAGDWYDFEKKAFREIDFDQFAVDYIRDLEFFLAES